jgi:hypothetical protein
MLVMVGAAIVFKDLMAHWMSVSAMLYIVPDDLINKVHALVNSETISPETKAMLKLAVKLTNDQIHKESQCREISKKTGKEINPNSAKKVWEAYTREFERQAEVEEARLGAESNNGYTVFDRKKFIKAKLAELKEKWAKQDREAKLETLKHHFSGRFCGRR